MLKDVISKARRTLKEAQQKHSIESAAAVEQVYADIKNLNTFINNEVDQIESDRNLNDRDRSNERRKIFEQAARKLELLKEKRTKSALIEQLETKLADESGKFYLILESHFSTAATGYYWMPSSTHRPGSKCFPKTQFKN